MMPKYERDIRKSKRKKVLPDAAKAWNGGYLDKHAYLPEGLAEFIHPVFWRGQGRF